MVPTLCGKGWKRAIFSRGRRVTYYSIFCHASAVIDHGKDNVLIVLYTMQGSLQQ